MGWFNKRKKEKEFLNILSDALQSSLNKSQEIGSYLLENQHPDHPKFGFCQERPICSLSLSGTEHYLSRLCTKDKKTFTWSHYTSIRATVGDYADIGEDKYTLYLDGEEYGELFFVPYSGVTEFPPAGLYFIDDNKDWDLEREAFGKGITAEELLRIRKIEKENEELSRQLKEKQQQSINAQLPKIRSKYPSFDSDVELNNKVFKFLAKIDFDLVIAYEYVHKDHLFTKKPPLPTCTDAPFSVEYYHNFLCDIEGITKTKSELYKSKTEAELRQEARERGLTLEQVIFIRKIEKDSVETRAINLKRIAEQVPKTKELFPSFDLSTDWENDAFKKITYEFGMPMAHEITHFYDYYTSNEALKEVNNPPLATNTQSLFCRKCGTKLALDSSF